MARAASEPASEELVRLLPRVVNVIHTLVGPTRANVTLTFHQFHALLLIGQDEEASPLKLSSAMGIATSTASELADRLVESGLVIRRRLREDRRRVHLRLSPEGQQALGKRIEELAGAMKRNLARLPGGEVEEMIGALKTILRIGSKALGRKHQ